MKIKELIKILSTISEQEKEIQIDSYGDPIDIVEIRRGEDSNYIITFHKGF